MNMDAKKVEVNEDARAHSELDASNFGLQSSICEGEEMLLLMMLMMVRIRMRMKMEEHKDEDDDDEPHPNHSHDRVSVHDA